MKTDFKYTFRLKLFILLLLLVSSNRIFAQQDAMYTHYMYNTLGVNPAYAGSRDALTFTGLVRSQWVGFDGAPNTQTFTAHSPVFTDAVNMGFSFIHDAIGPVNNTSLFIDYAFRFNVTDKAKLAFGLKVGFNNYNFSLASLQSSTNNDVAFAVGESEFSPNIGFGVYYSMENFYAGVSTPKLFQNNYLYSANDNVLLLEKNHFFFIVGSVFPITEDLKLKPTALLKITQAAPIEADITADFLFFDQFHLGAMLRTGDAVGVLCGYEINDQLFAGYSFDWSFVNKTAVYNAGSHELVLRYDFIYRENKKVRSPRYF